MSNSSSSSITALVPGGVVTTQNISTVIKPKENNNSMQFVKIQTPELSKSAVEQIRVAEESKISKSKIKEVEEEWQSNLLNWKSKRRQQFVGVHPNDNGEEQNNNGQENGRKIKTFAEMIEQRAKTGNRLNFHLQRYIGSDDSEHSQDGEGDESNERPEFINAENNNNDHSNLLNELDLRDREEDSETKQLNLMNESRGNRSTNDNNQQQLIQDRKNSVGSHDTIEDDERKDQFDQDKFILGNNNNRDFDDYDEVDQKPINSTLKQGIEKPPTPSTLHSTDGIRPMLSNDARPNDRLTLPSAADKYGDNHSDYDDEEPEEEEEEQKHLQRVAFVAKLKAFERMTQPTMREPKFVPTRTSKQQATLPPPLPEKQQSQPSSVLPPAKHHSPLLPPKQHSPILPQVQQQQQQQPLPPVPLPAKPMSSIPPRPEDLSPPRAAPVQQIPPPRQHPQARQTQPQPTQPQSQIKVPPQSPAQRHHVQPRQSHSQQLPPKMPQQSAHPHPQPPMQQHHSSHKEDKVQDRTVLSVSGKKRCSSCKEELGRGAAAFVIESLNLVYHTNCFRCSVCHVNLSNGFRGVDVRVHAGALHCQNCYSKDGLNYSRV